MKGYPLLHRKVSSPSSGVEMVEHIDRGDVMTDNLPKYTDEAFWLNYLTMGMISLMEHEMVATSHIRPPEGHERQIASQFVTVANQTVLIAKYINHLERGRKMDRKSICKLIRKLVNDALTHGSIWDIRDDSLHRSTMKLVAVTHYPASASLRSELASHTELIANTHYVLHYNGH